MLTRLGTESEPECEPGSGSACESESWPASSSVAEMVKGWAGTLAEGLVGSVIPASLSESIAGRVRSNKLLIEARTAARRGEMRFSARRSLGLAGQSKGDVGTLPVLLRGAMLRAKRGLEVRSETLALTSGRRGIGAAHGREDGFRGERFHLSLVISKLGVPTPGVLVKESGIA